MAEVIKMPKLSDTMTEGVVAKWHKKVGDTVNEGDLLAEIETDKATMEFESFEEGVLLHQGVQEGASAPVDVVLAIIGKKGEDVSALINGEEDISSKASVSQEQDEEVVEVSEEETIDVNATIVRMPKLSDTMSEGVVAKWHKSIGDKVDSGDLLADIETDKATMEFESFDEGVLLHIGVEEGGRAEVDAILAIIGEKGVDVSPFLKLKKPKKQAPTKSEPVAVKQEIKDTSKVVVASTTTSISGRIKVSPLAKKMAEEKGISLSSVKGTGAEGRIVKRDIEGFKGMASFTSNAVMEERYTEKPTSQMRKTVARRLSESKFTAPHFYLTIALDMDPLMAARKVINEVSPVKISFNDFVIKAVAQSLKKHPGVNASWRGDVIRYNEHVNVGVAVAVDEGLLVPVVRYADGKPMHQIASEVKEYAKKAKAKKLQPQDWEGSTFTISNLGMFGIEEFTAIVNPPDACIMAVGAIQQVPVVKNGQVVPGNKMKVTLSCDHRVVDGAVGSLFLNTFKKYMENPVLLLGENQI